MLPDRYVVVGAHVDRPDVPALLGVAVQHGVPVRAAALRPPATVPGGPDGPVTDGHTLSWHRLAAPVTPGTALADSVQRLVRSVLRGRTAELDDALRTDDWLRTALDRDAGSAGAGTSLLVALDDPAAQALSRWRARERPDVPLLTWDQAAERLAEQLGPLVLPPAGPSTELADAGAAGRGPRGNPGAMHRVTVAATPGTAPREDLHEALRPLRCKVAVLGPGERLPKDTDVLVLDGLGPAVAELLGAPAHLRAVHLPRPADRSNPWRHLLPRAGLVRPSGAVSGPAAAELGALVLGRGTAELAHLTRTGDDEEALRRAADALDTGAVGDPLLLREITYLARVTGSLTLEQRALLAARALRPGVDPELEEALDRVADRLRETDPGWLPALPVVRASGAGGPVLHLLKTTLPQHQAGYTVRAHHSLRALVEAGADVVAVAAPERTEPSRTTSSTVGEDAAGTVEEVVLDGVRYVIPAAVPARSGTAYLQSAAEVVMRVVLDERPALLHVHSGHRGYDLGVVGAAVAAATGLPWVYEVRGLFESTWTQDQRRAETGETFRRRMAREADLARRADATVTLAESMRKDLVARGVPEGRLRVVPNAVDPRQLRPVDRDPALARRLDAAGRFTFGYVSNLDHPREQVEDLVRAAVLLQSRGRPTLCLVVGTGAREQELRELVERLGAGGCVTFTGQVPHDDVAAYYALLDVLVVPRSSERAARLVTPLKPFEAMAMGLPVVVSSQPALLEVIGDDQRGWSYPAGDAGALADLLGRLADDPDGRAAVAARALHWVTRERTWAQNATRYLDLYGEVLSSAGAASSR